MLDAVDTRLNLFRLQYVFATSATVICAHNLGPVSKCALQVQPFEHTAAMLQDLQSLTKLHYDPAVGQFLDFGNHSEAMQLQQVMYRTPQGGLVRGPLQRTLTDPSQPPKLQLVPHFG